VAWRVILLLTAGQTELATKQTKDATEITITQDGAGSLRNFSLIATPYSESSNLCSVF
jgi:hypothetical protein